MRSRVIGSVLLAVMAVAAVVGSTASAAASTTTAQIGESPVSCRAWEATSQTGKASCSTGPYAPQVRVWIECYLEGQGSLARSYGPWTNAPSPSSRTCPAPYNVWRVGYQTR